MCLPSKDSAKSSLARLAVVGFLVGLSFFVAGRAEARSALLSAEAVAEELDYDLEPGRRVKLLLSKSTYAAEDVHLDAIVLLDGDPGARPFGELWYVIMDESGRALTNGPIYPVPGYNVLFSLEIPGEIVGRMGILEITWAEFYRNFGTARREFKVLPESGVATSGRVPLAVANVSGVPQRGVPVAVEVPFPRGALLDEAHVRLVDKAGREVPMRPEAAAKWSRFGSVKLLRCAFAVDAEGDEVSFFLEYGPEIRRAGDDEAVPKPPEGERPEKDPLRVSVDPEWVDKAEAKESARINGPETEWFKDFLRSAKQD